MPADVIQAEYDELAQTAKSFGQHADAALTYMQQVERLVEALEQGGWIGEAANKFFEEMGALIFPALHRLGGALHEAGSASIKISRAFSDAEEEAGNLFRGEGAGGQGSQGGQGAQPVAFTRQPGRPGGETDPGNPAERSPIYGAWAEDLRRQSGPERDIKFYDAASAVTKTLGMNDNAIAEAWLNLTGQNLTPAAANLLNQVGADLFSLNRDIHTQLQSGALTAPDGRLISPLTGQPVNSAFEWDTHMVIREQTEVENRLQAAVQRGEITQADVDAINGLVNINRAGGLTGAGTAIANRLGMVDTSGNEWAQRALGGNIDFGNMNNRVAIGWAMVYQQHGKSYEEYVAFARQQGIIPPQPANP
jgi:WXG100 family type VII secretion target